MDNEIIYDEKDMELYRDEAETRSRRAGRLEVDSGKVEQGLAKLVLTLVELIRRLMEKQALRRIENDSLTEEQIEELGSTFMKLEEKMQELKEAFDLEDEDLNLNLGPLGDLM